MSEGSYPKILILGVNGYVGTNLWRAFARVGLENNGCDHKTFDFLDFSRERLDEIHCLTDPLRYETIINCAGLPDLDRAVQDEDYRRRMHLVNTVAPILIASNYPGYFVQISSPFVLFKPRSEYAWGKSVVDDYVTHMRESRSLIVYPGWLYGGVESKQLDTILRNGIDKQLTIDNVKRANPTPIGLFCNELVDIIKKQRQGKCLIYGDTTMTAETFARDILEIWGDKWIARKYQDIATRPVDWSLDFVLPNNSHVIVHSK